MTRRQYLAMMVGEVAASLSPRLCRSEDGEFRLWVAISVETPAGANVSDARAAYRVWIRELYGGFGHVVVEPVPEIFIPSEELIRDVRHGTLDCYGVTALEFVKVADLSNPDFLVMQGDEADGIEYVLLVHKDSQVKKVADLRGAHIVSHLHRQMVLLPAWLDTMMSANNLPRAEQFFASHKLIGSLNQVVLPVFFRRVDGACVARGTWEMAAELNPQLGRDLCAVAMSPRGIPIIFAFRSSTKTDARQAFLDSIKRIYSNPVGQQIVALYQSQGCVVKPIASMKDTLEKVRQHERLVAHQATSRRGPA